MSSYMAGTAFLSSIGPGFWSLRMRECWADDFSQHSAPCGTLSPIYWGQVRRKSSPAFEEAHSARRKGHM